MNQEQRAVIEAATGLILPRIVTAVEFSSLELQRAAQLLRTQINGDFTSEDSAARQAGVSLVGISREAIAGHFPDEWISSALGDICENDKLFLSRSVRRSVSLSLALACNSRLAKESPNDHSPTRKEIA